MKLYCLATSLFLSAALFCAEHSPYDSQQYQARGLNDSNKQLLDLLEGKQPTIAGIKKAKIKHGCGATFDFVTPLRQGEGKSDGTYKKRLKYLQYYLGTGLKPSRESRWSELTQYTFDILKNFANAWALFKTTASDMVINGHQINHFEMANQHKSPEVPTPYGPLFVNEHKEICCRITEYDAALFALKFKKIRESNSSGRFEKLKACALNMLKEPELSDQAHKMILATLAHESLLSEYIRPFAKGENVRRSGIDLIAKFNKLRSTISKEDHTKVSGTLANLPHHTELVSLITSYTKEVFNAYKSNTYAIYCSNGAMIFSPSIENLYEKTIRYIPVFDDLEREYSTINDRINKALKTSGIKQHLPKKRDSQKTASACSDKPKRQVSEVHTINSSVGDLIDDTSQERHSTFVYHPRVKKWFVKRYTRTLAESDVRYHTLLPLEYDNLIVTHGDCSKRINKTLKGQLDDSYQMIGHVTFDDGTQEFYRFELCINPQGICYHRGCKKIRDHELFDTQLLEDDFHDDSLLESTNEDFDESEIQPSSPSVHKESPCWITITNPAYKSTIRFLKSNTDIN